MDKFEINNLQFIRGLLQKSLYISQQELSSILENKKDDIDTKNLIIKNVHGILSKTSNDRRDYYWIKVYVDEYEYWLSLFYNELDENTGNFHTQIGRIQFCKNIKNSTPNQYFVIDNKKNWCLNLDNYYQPKNMATFIGNEDYNPNIVVNEFIFFINEDLKNKRCYNVIEKE